MTVICVVSNFNARDYHYTYYHLTVSEALILFHERQLKEIETRLHFLRVELMKLQFHHKLHTGKDANLLDNFDNKLLNDNKSQDHLSNASVLQRAGFDVEIEK